MSGPCACHRRSRNALIGLLAVGLGSTALSAPAAAQRTLDIPAEEFEPFEREEAYKPNPLLTPRHPLDTFFNFGDIDMTGTLPDAVMEQLLGATPYAFADAVWEMEVTGSWTQSLSGSGTLQVNDFTEGMGVSGTIDPERFDGELGLRTYTARMPVGDDQTFTLSAAFPPSDGTGFGSELDGAKSAFWIYVCHMFERDRTGCSEDGRDSYYFTENPTIENLKIRGDRGSYSMRFTARVEEYHHESGPGVVGGIRKTFTGRVGVVRGWICEADAWEADPERCNPDEPLEVADSTPEPERENVNYAAPGIEVEFNQPVLPASIEDNFAVFTRNDHDDEVEISGRVEQLADDRFEFRPDALESGVRYEVRLRGGSNGVRAEDGGGQLAEDEVWRFSTLLNLSEQPPEERHASPAPGAALPMQGSVTDPLRLHTYQTVRDAPLVIGKPTLTRVYVDWAPHTHIHPDWQPETFEMEVEFDRLHPRVRGQGDTSALGSVVRIHRQDEFSAEDRRMGLHTINAFGWRPGSGDGGRREVSVQPHDPFPAPMEDAEEIQGVDVEMWDGPSGLNFTYAVAEVGAWEDGLPDAEAALMPSLAARTEDYAVQFLPFRSARGRFSGLSVDSLDLNVNMFREGELLAYDGLRTMVGQGDWLSSGERARMRLGPTVRFFQRVLRETAGRDEYLVIFVPPDTLGESAVGSAISQLKGPPYTGFRQYGNGAIILTLDAERYGVEQYATALVHEFGHVLNLAHPGGAAGSPEGRFDAIEGYRLDGSGLWGWNKSREEGNAEQKSTLVSLMWPGILPSSVVMPTNDEYRRLLTSIRRGWRSTLLTPEFGVRYAQARQDGRTVADVSPPTSDMIVVSGQLDPDSDSVLIEPMMLRAHDLPASGGDYTAELHDRDGAVLQQARFGLSETSADGGTGGDRALTRLADPDDPSWWRRFRVALAPDPRASRLVIRDGGQVLARMDAPGAPPSIALAEAGALSLGPEPLEFDWVTQGDAALRYDVEYSSDGAPPWRMLSFRQAERAFTLNPADLPNGPDPKIRVTVHDGFHFARAEASIERTSALTPPRVRLPHDNRLAPGSPIELMFDAPIPTGELSRRLSLTDAHGDELDIEFVNQPDRHRVGITTSSSIEEDASYTLRLDAGLADRWDDRLATALSWTLLGADSGSLPSSTRPE